MRVSRDFIDSILPRSPEQRPQSGHTRRPSGTPRTVQCSDSGAISLVFGFQNRSFPMHPGFIGGPSGRRRPPDDLFQHLIALDQAGGVVLALAEEGLERLVQPDGLIVVGCCAWSFG